MLPGTPARASHDYVRRGTSSLYTALDLTTGKVIGVCTHAIGPPNSWLSLERSTLRSPTISTYTLVLDNASTHTTPAVENWLTNQPRFVFAFHPDQLLMAQHGRTPARRTDHQDTAPQHQHLGPSTELGAVPCRGIQDRTSIELGGGHLLGTGVLSTCVRTTDHGYYLS